MNLLLRDELAMIIAEEISAAPPREEAAATLPVVLQTPRARAIRRISEIVLSRQWHLEVVRTLDNYKVSYVDDLPDDGVFKLRDRMEYFEDCVQCACDPDDAPPAR